MIMMTRRVVAKASRNFKATAAKKLRKVTQDTKNCNDVTGPSKSSTFKSNFRRLQLPNSFVKLHKVKHSNYVTQDKISMSLFRRLQQPKNFGKLHQINSNDVTQDKISMSLFRILAKNFCRKNEVRAETRIDNDDTSGCCKGFQKFQGYSSQKTSESCTGYKNCNDVTGPSKSSTFKSNFRRLQLPNSFVKLHKVKHSNYVTQDKISMSLFRRLQQPKNFGKLHRIKKIAMMLQDLPRVPHLSLILEGCNCQTAS